MSARDDRLYLLHIAECIARVKRYTRDGWPAFIEDTRTQDAVLRNLQVLAESTQRISAERKATHPEVDWKSLSGFRNVVVHDYLGVDLFEIWRIVERDLPGLASAVESMLEEPSQQRADAASESPS